MTEQELGQIIKENKEALQGLEKRLAKIEKSFTWSTIFGFVKAVVIAAPIVFGIIYFTPILKDYVRIFEPIVKTIQLGTNNLVNGSKSNQLDVNNVVGSFCDPQAREALVKDLCK